MDSDKVFIDKTMNRQQQRAARSAMRRTNDLGAGLLAARQRGWVPEAVKATTVLQHFRPRKKGTRRISKNDLVLAMSLGIGRGPDATHARLAPKERNKKRRLKRALRRAGWVLG